VFVEPGPSDYGGGVPRQDSVFSLWYDDPDRAFVIATQPEVQPGLFARNFPVILRTDLEIRQVGVACYGGF
jgi:hypothetical protein